MCGDGALMRRVLAALGCFIAIIGVFGVGVVHSPTRATNLATTLHVGEVKQMHTGDAVSVALFKVAGEHLDLRLTLLDGEGDLFQPRVQLSDGQEHTVVLHGQGDVAPEHRFSFRRVGDTVEMTATTTEQRYLPKLQELWVRYGQGLRTL